MNILLVFHHLRYPSERGGQRSREVAEALASRGHTVHVLVPNIDPLTEVCALKKIGGLWAHRQDIYSYKEIRYWVPKTPRNGLLGRAVYSLAAFLNAFLFCIVNSRRFDVVAVTSHPLPIAFSSLPCLLLSRARLIVEVRDVPVDVAVERGLVDSTGYFYRIYKYLELKLLLKANLVICYSSKMLDITGLKGVARENAHIIPIGAEFDVDLPPAINDPLDRGLKICFFGTLGRVLDLEVVFEMIKSLIRLGVPARLDLYGDGEMESDIRKKILIGKLPVELKGSIPRSSVPLTCAKYDFAVYPVVGGDALLASLGNKFFDYITARVPIIVIGSDSEPGRLVAQHKLGVVGDSPDALAENIACIYNKAKSNCVGISSFFDMNNTKAFFNKNDLLLRWVIAAEGLK